MTMDKSLRMRGSMARTRNVLTRDERIGRLQAADRWQEGDSPFGLAKVRVYKLAMKKKRRRRKTRKGPKGKPPLRKPPRPRPQGRPREGPSQDRGQAPAKK